MADRVRHGQREREALTRLTRKGLRRTVAVVAIVLATVLGVLIWQPRWAIAGLAGLMPRILWHVEGAGPRIALTFDDGPSAEHTPRVLDILRRRGARATFFLIGSHAIAHPALVARIRAEGHEVANHYWDKGTTLFTPEDEFVAQVLRTEAILHPVGPPKLFRPPGGLIRPSNRVALDRLGYRCVIGSAYPFDGNGPPTGYIRWLVTKNLGPGTVVILHDGVTDPSRTIAALDDILVAAAAKGLSVVTVGELLDVRATVR